MNQESQTDKSKNHIQGGQIRESRMIAIMKMMKKARRRRDVFAVISMERMLYKKGGKEQTAGHRYNALARDKREDVHRKTKYSSLHRERAILHSIPLHLPSSSILHFHQPTHTSIIPSNLILGIKKIPQPLLLILFLAILILAISSCRLSTTIISFPRRRVNSAFSRRQRS